MTYLSPIFIHVTILYDKNQDAKIKFREHKKLVISITYVNMIHSFNKEVEYVT